MSDADFFMKIIKNGACNRSTGSTSKNAGGSRSHAILQISVQKSVGRKQNMEHGRLMFIGIAWSEQGADVSNARSATWLEVGDQYIIVSIEGNADQSALSD